MERVLGGTDKLVLDQQNGGSSPGVVPYLPLSEIGRRTPPAVQPQGGSTR
jgi:modulator of FtsH protease HflK